MKHQSIIAAFVGLSSVVCAAQPFLPGKVDIPFNRYYNTTELYDYMRQIEQAYPDICTVEEIGKSQQGRPLLVATVNNPKTGPHDSKPAMWIDGNVHGNEIQAAEVVLYSLWYLTKGYGQNQQVTDLVDNYSFYFMCSQNPDGRDYWFEEANTSSSSRQSKRPTDNDQDGLIDEDTYDDLDGDGSITQMWKADPEGAWRRSQTDPRVFERAPEGELGGWTSLGSEGIDNDGDGRTNEDGPFGDDMNRSWPSGWQPGYIQNNAAPYPLWDPETRAIAKFILDRPNIMAGQSYHNSGGMILRGPGASFRGSFYPPQDVAVYDEIGRVGAEMLPYYNYWIIFQDLYTVHGGFVNWLAEGLGALSFTNEMMTNARFFQRDVTSPSDAQEKIWRDYMSFGTTFKDYEWFDHPEHGKVLVGGPNKWSSRNTPTFMLEEECHRNFAFTMFHAAQMPIVEFSNHEVVKIGENLWQVTVQFRNENAMPSRLAIARQRNIGTPDILTLSIKGRGQVVSSGRVGDWADKQFSALAYEPARVLVDAVPGKGTYMHRFILHAAPGASVQLTYEGQKIRDISASFEVVEHERSMDPVPVGRGGGGGRGFFRDEDEDDHDHGRSR